MTPDPVILVARVRALGIAIRADGDTLVLSPGGVAPPDLRAALVAAKPAVLAVLRAAAPTVALRAAYRRCFALVVAEADGERLDPRDAQAIHQEIIRLTDDAGPQEADVIFAEELRRFRWDTGRCGLCGGLGHETTHESGDLSQ
jgi:hypothetical protein